MSNNQKNKDDYLRIRIQKDLKLKFKEVAKLKGRTMTEFIYALVLREVANNSNVIKNN